MSRLSFVYKPGSRIDTAYAEEELLHEVEDFYYKVLAFSDHRAFSITFKTNKIDEDVKIENKTNKYNQDMANDKTFLKMFQESLNVTKASKDAYLLKNMQKIKRS